MLENRFIRMRQYNADTRQYTTLYPQTIASNILRQSDGNTLEDDMVELERHKVDIAHHLNTALSYGTSRKLKAKIYDVKLTDGMPLLLTTHTNIECEPTLNFNETGEKHIVTGNGERIPGGQCEGSVMFMIWSQYLDAWILLSTNEYTDITKVVVPIENEYAYKAPSDGISIIDIPGFDYTQCKLVVNYGQTILRPELDYTFIKEQPSCIKLKDFTIDKDEIILFTITSYETLAKRGTYNYDLISHDYAVTVRDQYSVNVPTEGEHAHSIVINHGQTILRNNLDYEYNDTKTKITMKYPLDIGDTLVFTITRFEEVNGDVVPNNWGATGNYRYKYKVIHTEFTAERDNTTVIPVPQFNAKSDDLSVIKDNQLYIFDVDYTIDEIGQVVLLNTSLAKDETIYFTIRQGGMFDVPNFNVIHAVGFSGQHILIDMSYGILCNDYCLLIKLKKDLETAPTLKCIDGPAEPIVNCYGAPITSGYKAGSYLWCVYDEDKHVWYSLGHGQMDVSDLVPDVIVKTGTENFVGNMKIDDKFMEVVVPHGLGVVPNNIEVRPCEPPNMVDDEQATIGDIWYYADDTNIYVGNSGNATSKFFWYASSESTAKDLRSYIDLQIATVKSQPGKMDIRTSAYTATADGTYVIDSITDFNKQVDKLIVNFGQTLLREGIDYETTSNNGIMLTHIQLNTGDIIQFMVIKQLES